MHLSLFSKKSIVIPAKIIFSFIVAFFFLKLIVYHAHFIVYPYPHEFREGAMMTTTEALVKGINPYALEHQPQYTNDYGIVYPAVVYPFAKLFGTTMLVHRAVTAVFIFACCALLFLVMRRLQVPFLLNTCAVTILYASFIFPHTTTPGANPSMTGLFLFLVCIFLPWFMSYSKKSLVISVIAGILAYYTKPYFFVCIPFMASYLFFFVSKKKGIGYTALFMVLMTLSVIVMHNIFETYFNNCFFIHTNIQHLYWSHMFRQLKEYAQFHRYLLILLAVVLAPTIFQTGRDLWRTARISIREFNKPLISAQCPLVLYCGLLALGLLCYKFGRHQSAWMWYFFHLLSPFLIVYAFSVFSRYRFWYLFFVPIFYLNLNSFTHTHNYTRLDTEIHEWKMIEEQITKHENIFNAPLIAPLLIEQNKPVYDNGLSEHFKIGAFRWHPLTKLFFKPGGEIILQHYRFLNKVREMIERQEFDLVVLQRNYSPLTPGALEDYYQFLGTMRVRVPHDNMDYDLTFWKPK